MINNTITGKEYALKDIFSKKFQFHIPPYQRPYAWTDEQTLQLFEDLYDFYNLNSTDSYFLGSIILIKDNLSPKADVVDGQQRLTTLSILISVLASELNDIEAKNECKNYLIQKGNALENINAHPRLYLRSKDQPFFETYIQNLRIKDLDNINPLNLDNESQRLILLNALLLKEKIRNEFNGNDSKLLDFLKFLINRCFLVTVQTPNRDFAFRIFSIMNDRGLDLMPTDIIKSNIIGKIPANLQDDYTDKWESLEDYIGRVNFNDVFVHTRTIYTKTKPKKSWTEEFNESITSNFGPEYIIDQIITPFVEAYSIIRKSNYSGAILSEEINYYLKLLNLIDYSDWVPVVMSFLSQCNDPNYILYFLKKIERITAYLYLTNKTLVQRTLRFREILIDMETHPNHSLNSPLSSLELKDVEIKDFKSRLDGEVYLLNSKKKSYLIVRIESFLSDSNAEKFALPAFIDTVLPQFINKETQKEWLELWPDHEERELWINRLANLAPLSKRVTKKRLSTEFENKKNIYFNTNSKNEFKITQDILKEKIWSKSVLQERQNYLLETAFSGWDLKKAQKESIQYEEDINNITFYISKNNCEAKGQFSEKGFRVLKGSEINVPETAIKSDRYFTVRKNLINKGIIQKQNNKWILMKTLDFSSPSAASSFVLARSTSGPQEWKTKSGIPLKDLKV